MCRGQECVDLVAARSQRKSVGPLLRRHLPEFSHSSCIEYIDHAWIAHGDIEALMNAIEEHDVRSTTQGILAQDPSGTCIKCNQCVGVAGAEDSVRLCIKIEAVGTRRRNSESNRNRFG